jgi:hypothetical protein
MDLRERKKQEDRENYGIRKFTKYYEGDQVMHDERLIR